MEEIGNSELIAIQSILDQPVIKADAGRVGFVFPLYYLGLPRLVERFIRKIDLKDTGTIFYVNTSGSDDGEDCSTGKINKILAGEGRRLTGGYNIPMPSNYIKMYDPDPEEEERRKLEASENSIKDIARKIVSGVVEVKPDRMGWVSALVNSFWQVFMVSRSDRGFFVTDACNSCGLCAKVCPVENIRLVNGKPAWRHHCQECLACMHFCPRTAIQTEKAVGKPRYHHPWVEVKELIQNREE